MTVYVDDMEVQHLRYKMCHMIASSDQELRAMAERIGVTQRYHQGDHFDIAKVKRGLAVAAGAVEITQRQCAAMRARQRATGELGSPETAVAWLRQYMRDRKTSGEDASGVRP